MIQICYIGCIKITYIQICQFGTSVGFTVDVGLGVAVAFFFTVILHTAFAFLLLLLTAVIVAFPAFFAVTFPLELTVVIFLLEVFQVTALDAFAGFTVFTFKVTVFPSYNVLLVAFSLIDVAFFVLSSFPSFAV